MKIERLLKILIYMFNRPRVTARELSDYFEVSLRTIQRDIDSLTLAGLPIIAYPGVSGGYEIMQDYKLPLQIASDEDYQAMVMALNGLSTAIQDERIQHTLEKIKSLSRVQAGPIDLNFHALHENLGMNQQMKQIIEAIKAKTQIICEYHNTKGETKLHTLEPLLLQYRWYAWYVIAYDTDASSYRRYKLVRMSEVKQCNKSFTIIHESLDTILNTMDRDIGRVYHDFDIRCDESLLPFLNEYLNGIKDQEGDLIHFHLPVDELSWRGHLLAMGNRITILNNEVVKQELLDLCQNFINQQTKS